jgi:hypothetical protein
MVRISFVIDTLVCGGKQTPLAFERRFRENVVALSKKTDKFSVGNLHTLPIRWHGLPSGYCDAVASKYVSSQLPVELIGLQQVYEAEHRQVDRLPITFVVVLEQLGCSCSQLLAPVSPAARIPTRGMLHCLIAGASRSML